VFAALVKNLPEVESRRHASTAQVAWLVHSALSKDRTRVTDWLPAFAQVDGGARGIRAMPAGWKEDLAVGTSRGWVRQELLDAITAVMEA
jgi:hypothetical protein